MKREDKRKKGGNRFKNENEKRNNNTKSDLEESKETENIENEKEVKKTIDKASVKENKYEEKQKDKNLDFSKDKYSDKLEEPNDINTIDSKLKDKISKNKVKVEDYDGEEIETNLDKLEKLSAENNKLQKRNKIIKILFRFIIVIIILSVLVIGVLAGFFYSKFGKIKRNDIDVNNIGISENARKNLSDYKMIALFGLDTEPDQYDLGDSRSDTIMCIILNNKTNEVKIVSVYRDTYVEVDEENGTKLDKINHAYWKGGAQNALKSLNKALDLNVEDYVSANFKVVMDVVDYVGGVDVNIKSDEIENLNKFINETYIFVKGSSAERPKSPDITHSGTQKLDGLQAMAYSRIRYTTGKDYRRTERQRTIINAVLKKVKGMNLTELNGLANKILPEIESSLSATELLEYLPKLSQITITESIGWPYKTRSWGDAPYGVPCSLQTNVERLHKEVLGEENYEPSDTVKNMSKEITDKTGLNENSSGDEYTDNYILKK